MRYYLDSAPVIYLVERSPAHFAAIHARLSVPEGVLVASELTRMECRVRPLKLGDAALLKDFDDYFDSTVAEIVALTRVVIDHATEIRAEYGFKTPDAIRLAAAAVSDCDVFLTNDHRLRRFADITIEVI